MIELKVERMTCGGCAATVRAAVAEVAPKARMEIEIAPGRCGWKATPTRRASRRRSSKPATVSHNGVAAGPWIGRDHPS